MARAVAELEIKVKPRVDTRQIREALRRLEQRVVLQPTYVQRLAGATPYDIVRNVAALTGTGELSPRVIAGVLERARAAERSRATFTRRAQAASTLLSAYGALAEAVSAGVPMAEALAGVSATFGGAAAKAAQEMARARAAGESLSAAVGVAAQAVSKFSAVDLVGSLGKLTRESKRAQRYAELAGVVRAWAEKPFPTEPVQQPSGAGVGAQQPSAPAPAAAPAPVGDVQQTAAAVVAAGAQVAGSAAATADAMQDMADAAKASGGPLSRLRAALERLRDALRGLPERVGRYVRSLRAPRVPRVGEDAALASALASMRVDAEGKTKAATVAELSRQIRAALEFAGVRASGAMVRVAAHAVQQGQLTIAQAVQAFAVGTKQYKRVLADAGLQTALTTKRVRELTNALKLAAIASGKLVPAPETPLAPSLAAQLPPAGQALAIGAAMETAALKAKGFMKALLTLRWEIFTVMFFMFLFGKAISFVFRVTDEGAKALAAATAATRGLAYAGVRDISGLVLALKEASGGYYTVYEAATRLSAMFAAGLPPEMMEYAPRLMEIARAIAALRGTDVEEVFKAITESIIRAEFRMARTAGALTGNLEDLLQTFQSYVSSARPAELASDELAQTLIGMGVATARSTAALTAQQKQWLLLWGVMHHGRRVVEALGSDFDQARTQIQELKTAVEELKLSLEMPVAAAVAPFVYERLRDVYAKKGFEVYVRRTGMRYAPEEVYERWLVRELRKRGIEEVALGAAAYETAQVYMARLSNIRRLESRLIEAMRDELVRLGREEFAREVLMLPERVEQTWRDAGAAVRSVGRAASDAAKGFSQLSEAADEAAESVWKLASDAVLDSLRAAGAMMERWRYEDKDRETRWRREDEDLEREHRERLADAENEYRRNRQRAEKQYQDRTEEARRDYARRLAEIERELAEELRRIWEEYNLDFWQYELERDALGAILAARRRDQRIAEAQREAELRRQEAYDAYIDAIENAQRQHQEELAQLREQYQQRLDEVKSWYEKELEERRIARQRELEDVAEARRREREELIKDLMLRLAEIQIMNNRKLTEQEKYHALAYALMVRYSGMTSDEVARLLYRLTTNWSQGLAQLQSSTANVFGQILQLRNMYAQLLQQPIVIPVVWQQFGTPPGGYQMPPPSRPTQPVPRATGGVDIVRSPTLFLMGERGPELVVSVPLSRIGPFRGQFTHHVRAVVSAEVSGMEARITNAVYRALEQVF